MITRTKVALGALAAGLVDTVLLAATGEAHDRRGKGRGWQRYGGPGMGQRHLGLMLDQVDGDRDGRIIKAELDGFIADCLRCFDRDADGRLAQDEFAAYLAEVTRPAQVRAFQFLDADGDRRIIEPELRHPPD